MNLGSIGVSLQVSINGLDQRSIEAAGSTMTSLTSTNVMDENSFNEPKKVSSILLIFLISRVYTKFDMKFKYHDYYEGKKKIYDSSVIFIG